ncbi:fused MFS/spermidine synthase [Horticoccus sp. 23ND18S-11]|uniref:fused MFS/spermidine synthase n=1 Tax=Horticoccus sp. 23ND18S-11 TaxID=3391832 RepID=UPI0039C8EDDA
MSGVASPRFLIPLLLLFVGSGCAALIYEIVWFQFLQLVIGSSAVSLAVLLGTFMGGMCLGSLTLPKLVAASHHPLRVYAVLEFGTALAGLVVLAAVPVLGQVYTSLVGHGLPGILLRATVCVIVLLPPTVLMGATLPAMARWIETSPRGLSWLGFFYAGNTLGAVLGCLLAGFYLLRVHDGTTATLCAVGLNIAVALIALVLARVAPHRVVGSAGAPPASSDFAGGTPALPGSHRLMLVGIMLSGFCALAAEVVWARMLSLLLGATVYTFSIILAVFLTGLGLGSSVGASLARNVRSPRLAFAGCQLLQIGAIAWAAHAIAFTLPYWQAGGATPPTLAAKFQFDLVRCAWAILPATLLWGASFPLALASLASPGADPARLVGRAYAANTLGAIAGAVLASLILIPSLGTQHTQVVLMALAVIAGVLALRLKPWFEPVTALAGIAVAFVVASTVPAIPWQLVAYGRQIASTDYGAHLLYFGEGMNSSVAVSETAGGARFFHVSGKTEASSLEKDMRLQRMLGHIPALLHPNPKSVLIVGCGAGVTSGTFVLHPSIERIVICDIEPLIPQVVASHFRLENHDVIRDPRVQIVYDDARHFIATTREKFDLITSDPIHPWVKGSAVLYSQEYFELCRERLKPGGLVTQWVPLYEADRAVVQSEIATFFTVFPHGTIWANDDEGFGYDTVMLGQAEPLAVDVDALQQRFERTDHRTVRAALTDLGLGSAVDLLSTYAGRFSELKTWLAPAEINRDRNLRLQYLAGLQLDSNKGTDTYAEILGRRTFPSDLFLASPERLLSLRQALGELAANPLP